MLKQFRAVTGSLASAFGGALGMSEEHRRFVASGGLCGQCGARLTKPLGGWSANFYDAEQRKLSNWTGGGIRAETVECPKCNHRWKMYGDAPALQPAGASMIEVLETTRSEEFLGEDRRVIDNSKSSGTPSRSFSFGKEWSKTFHVEMERARSDGAELTMGSKDAAGLRLSSEEKLRRTYAVSEDTKETTTETVTCEVPAWRKLTVVVRWKRIGSMACCG